jgi:hypothetical protein
MRITRELLQKTIDDTVSRRTRSERSIVAIYLCGSLLGDDFLLGGTTDIDLGILHYDTPAVEREIVRLTDDVHLDVAHYPQKLFQQTRQVRMHPWLGPTIHDCKVVYDPHHFMDFTQASVRGQFHRDDYVAGRARQRLEHSRQIWLGFVAKPSESASVEDVGRYLKAIEHAANAVASLSGAPLTERRLLLNFRGRAEAVNRPGLHAALLGVLGAHHLDGAGLQALVVSWQAALETLPVENIQPRLHPARRSYYSRAVDALLKSQQPASLLWPLLRTWTLAASLAGAGSAAYTGWQQACAGLGLQGEGFNERISALDSFLDMVDETIEVWLKERGG